ncbi:DUF971 domain-containing protein [Hansschlegelia quercus]|uniref:DUF971 domain-containing protein n=1 Tax=Hansschlegelia quercus TaxID=2528245 RepID=UPI001FE1A47E|nr:DUF971 domain-containing protein [Hansschlegelia quercus]
MVHSLEAITAQPHFDPAETPVEAAVSRGGGTLTLTFSDGPAASVAAGALRLRCRCAWCTRARADGRFPDAFDGAAIVAVEAVGGYAAHLVFADGHDRGIFPWSYLRAIAAETGPATGTA